MKTLLLSAVAAGLMATAPAFAATTIDFDGPASFDSIADYYAGLGVDFGLDALAIQNDFDTYFSNSPSNVGVMTAVGADAAMNVAAGFTGTASFFYSSLEAVTVGVYSGLNGTGTLLGSFELSANADLGCSDSAFCNWTETSLSFNGVAKSIAFGAAADVAGFDNVTISAVPEPSQAIMLALGLSVIGARSLRRRKSVK
jgi:hypothetical protein